MVKVGMQRADARRNRTETLKFKILTLLSTFVVARILFHAKHLTAARKHVSYICIYRRFGEALSLPC